MLDKILNCGVALEKYLCSHLVYANRIINANYCNSTQTHDTFFKFF